MIDMALRKELALQAAAKPLASGPEGARQLADAGRGLAAGAFGDRWNRAHTEYEDFLAMDVA